MGLDFGLLCVVAVGAISSNHHHHRVVMMTIY